MVHKKEVEEDDAQKKKENSHSPLDAQDRTQWRLLYSHERLKAPLMSTIAILIESGHRVATSHTNRLIIHSITLQA